MSEALISRRGGKYHKNSILSDSNIAVLRHTFELIGVSRTDGQDGCLTMDHFGDVYVAGTKNANVRRISGTDGTIIWSKNYEDHLYFNITNIAADNSGNLYIQDHSSGILMKLSHAEGTEIWEEPTTNSYFYSNSVDGDGNIWTITDDNHLKKISGKTGDVILTCSGSFKSVAVDSDNNIYAVYHNQDDSIDTIEKLNGSDGTVIWTTNAGNANNVVVDKDKNIYVTSYYESGVSIKKLSGTDGTIIWSKNYVDFTSATDNSVDGDGNIWTITDDNHLKKISGKTGDVIWYNNDFIAVNLTTNYATDRVCVKNNSTEQIYIAYNSGMFKIIS